jgi:membrane-associated phospholipid phosphatase
MPVLVALSRIYRGEHHPTDVLGSLLFSALWLTATYVLLKPNADGSGRTAKRPHRVGSANVDRIAASRRMFARPGTGRNPGSANGQRRKARA